MTLDVEDVDLSKLNSLAAGTDKKNPRIVAAGFAGKLMGTKSLVNVTADQITQDSLSELERRKLEEKLGPQAHISEQEWTMDNWHKHINWLNMALVIFVPIIGIGLTLFVPPQFKTTVLAFVMYLFSGISITAGYHRLFAHKAYDACTGVKIFFALFGAGAIQGSIKWWAHSHRVHHRYTDTRRDPYDARRGFFYSHLGWMLTMANPKNRARADIADLTSDWVVTFQHRHYLSLMLIMSWALPTLIAGLGWGDYWGGFIYAGILKAFLIQQVTFCVNSLAHWIGSQPFDDRRTPRDHVITAFVTFGEGYHNFHHEFPSDYRNALKWFQYDPTKVFIWTLSKVGLAWNLKTFSSNAIEQGLVQQQQKKLDRIRNKLSWGIPVDQLPVWDREEFSARAEKEKLIIVSGIVHNVKDFIPDHPGGQALIRASIGKDATKVFHGAVYRHSNAANNLLANLRVAVIRDAKVETEFEAVRERFDKEKEQ